jgi:hypothetical protein
LPIPEALWASAAAVAREHGVFRTAKILRLEYGKLKRMAESDAPATATAPPAEFLELVAPQRVGLSECIIELEGARGKMRIQWKGAAAPDLAGLSRALWEGCLFVFRSRRGTSIRILVYDGQGFWLAQKRLSQGRFVWWPSGKEASRVLQAHQAQLLLAAGNPETEAAPVWRKVS